jgi:hypothetical protein
MRQWIANCLWDALKLVAGRLHDWAFDPQRAVAARFRDRERWWSYRQKALQTKDPRDDMRAEWWRIRFAFETSPADAIERGDLKG